MAADLKAKLVWLDSGHGVCEEKHEGKKCENFPFAKRHFGRSMMRRVFEGVKISYKVKTCQKSRSDQM